MNETHPSLEGTYLKPTYDAMQALIPNLHEASYVHLIDARAAAYGYAGKAQEFRYQHK